MRFSIKTILILLGLSQALLSGCGKISPGKAQKTDKTEYFQGVVKKESINTIILGRKGIDQKEVSARSGLRLYFAASEQGAVFECRDKRLAYWGPCNNDNSFEFKDLKIGETYYLEVRAVSFLGNVDPSPEVLEFKAVAGDGNTDPYLNSEAQSEKVVDLRKKIDKQLAGQDIRVAVGPFFRATAPRDFSLRNFSTTQTLSEEIYAVSQVFEGQADAPGFGSQGCDRNFERPFSSSDGRSYCEATSSIGLYQSSYGRQFPLNHLELVSQDGDQVTERWVVAGYGSWEDSSEGAFSAGTICVGAVQRGRSRIRLPSINWTREQIHNVDWCVINQGNGEYWWQGMLWLRVANDPSAPRLALVYGISSKKGINRYDKYMMRLKSIIPDLVEGSGQ